jgi:hypothetical protein
VTSFDSAPRRLEIIESSLSSFPYFPHKLMCPNEWSILGKKIQPPGATFPKMFLNCLALGSASLLEWRILDPFKTIHRRGRVCCVLAYHNLFAHCRSSLFISKRSGGSLLNSISELLPILYLIWRSSSVFQVICIILRPNSSACLRSSALGLSLFIPPNNFRKLLLL